MRPISSFLSRWSLLGAVALSTVGARAQCLPHTTTRVVAGCAPSWGEQVRDKNAESFNPWVAQSILAPLGTPAAIPPATPCAGQVQITRVDENDHLALVVCAQGAASTRTWINLDDLQCEENNAWAQSVKRGNFNPQIGQCVTDPSLPTTGATQGSPDGKFPQQILSRAKAEQMESYQKIVNDTHHRITADLLHLLDGVSPPGQKPDAKLTAKIWLAATQLESLFHHAADAYGPQCDQPAQPQDATDLIRGERTCALFKIAYEKAVALAQIPDPVTLAAEISRYGQSHPPDVDFLALRMALFYAFTPAEQAALVTSNRVHYARRSREIPTIKSGPYELNDGYVYGGARLGKASGNANDCSDFSSILMQNGMDAPPVHALKIISQALLAKTEAERARLLNSLNKKWQAYAACFAPVDLRGGALDLRPLDLVLSNTETPAQGHVVVVKSFDPQSGEITDLEAKGGADGNVGEYVRPIYEKSCNPRAQSPATLPPPRADLFALRYKEQNNTTCPLNLESTVEPPTPSSLRRPMDD